jgi:dihydroneopterin aldolase
MSEAFSIFVRGLSVDAEIGIYPHERGRTQPLILDVELSLTPGRVEHIAETVNYETVVEEARRIAADGHMNLVETFADRLARALLADERVLKVRVRVEKPQALAPHAQAAGVEVVVLR